MNQCADAHQLDISRGYRFFFLASILLHYVAIFTQLESVISAVATHFYFLLRTSSFEFIKEQPIIIFVGRHMFSVTNKIILMAQRQWRRQSCVMVKQINTAWALSNEHTSRQKQQQKKKKIDEISVNGKQKLQHHSVCVPRWNSTVKKSMQRGIGNYRFLSDSQTHTWSPTTNTITSQMNQERRGGWGIRAITYTQQYSILFVSLLSPSFNVRVRILVSNRHLCSVDSRRLPFLYEWESHPMSMWLNARAHTQTHTWAQCPLLPCVLFPISLFWFMVSIDQFVSLSSVLSI